jgi:hypothetical protein
MNQSIAPQIRISIEASIRLYAFPNEARLRLEDALKRGRDLSQLNPLQKSVMMSGATTPVKRSRQLVARCRDISGTLSHTNK